MAHCVSVTQWVRLCIIWVQCTSRVWHLYDTCDMCITIYHACATHVTCACHLWDVCHLCDMSQQWHVTQVLHSEWDCVSHMCNVHHIRDMCIKYVACVWQSKTPVPHMFIHKCVNCESHMWYLYHICGFCIRLYHTCSTHVYHTISHVCHTLYHTCTTRGYYANDAWHLYDTCDMYITIYDTFTTHVTCVCHISEVNLICNMTHFHVRDDS